MIQLRMSVICACVGLGERVNLLLDADKRGSMPPSFSRCSQYAVSSCNVPTGPLNNLPNSLMILSQLSAEILSRFDLAVGADMDFYHRTLLLQQRALRGYCNDTWV
jgi:hypothetical protein